MRGCEARRMERLEGIKILVPPIPPNTFENCSNIQVEYYVQVNSY